MDIIKSSSLWNIPTFSQARRFAEVSHWYKLDVQNLEKVWCLSRGASGCPRTLLIRRDIWRQKNLPQKLLYVDLWKARKFISRISGSSATPNYQHLTLRYVAVPFRCLEHLIKLHDIPWQFLRRKWWEISFWGTVVMKHHTGKSADQSWFHRW